MLPDLSVYSLPKHALSYCDSGPHDQQQGKESLRDSGELDGY